MFSKPDSNDKYTPKTKKFQKIRWFCLWILIFLFLIAVSQILGPYFIKSDAQAMKLSHFSADHSWLFLVVHLLLAISSIWWFPWYAKRQGVSKGATPEAIQKVIGYKWMVVVILVAFTLMLRFI